MKHDEVLLQHLLVPLSLLAERSKTVVIADACRAPVGLAPPSRKVLFKFNYMEVK